jgi:Protein of unknown function (DUF3102)
MNESMSFHYDELDSETRAFIQQKTDEIHSQLKRTAQGVIDIGHNLQAVKERIGHGHFMAWVKSEFGMTHMSAVRFMRVAEQFEGKCNNLLHLPLSVLYELAAPSMPETVVEGVLSGEISPTLQAVREAKEAEQRASAAERQARTERERSTAQVQLAALTSEIERLQGKMAQLSTSPVKEIPVIPAEVSRQMEALRANVQTLTRQRDTLSGRVEELSEQVRASARGREEEDAARRLRLAWQATSNAFQNAVTKVLVLWPTPLDTLSFEAAEWNRVEQVKALCQRVIEQCQGMREATTITIVDADTTPRKERRDPFSDESQKTNNL